MSTKINKKTCVIIFLFALLTTIFSSNNTAWSYEGEAATVEQYVRAIEAKSRATASNSSLNSAQKVEKLSSIFLDVVDTEWMAKFAMGKSWNSISSTDQQKYLNAYRKYLVRSYADKFSKYTGQAVTINAISPSTNQQFMVDTTITLNGQPFVISYRCKLYSPDNIKIRDITAEGISLLSTQRSEFNSLISQRGFDGLIEALNNNSQPIQR